MPTSPGDHTVTVSIVVPMHNAELHLRECLDSLVHQTLHDLEILCFDDASTDSTGSIVAEYASRDDRVRLTTYPENRSSSQARKDGALGARGRYLMFVDADDYLELTACEELAARMAELDVDVLQFGTNIINVSNSDAARIAGLERFLAPLQGRLDGAEPFETCFLLAGYGHSLWNKIYRTAFAKEAFTQVPDGSYPKAQDVLAYFVLAWHARSYVGITDRFYNYRFGSGITGASEMSLDRLTFYCSQSLVADAADRFVAQHDGTPEQFEAARRVRQNLVSDCVQQWFRRTPRSVSSAGFDILARAWSMDEIAGVLHRHLHDQVQGVAERLSGAHSLASRTDRIPDGGTIGVFYHRLSIGGVQRVISILIPMYLRMGYRVVMLVEEDHAGAEFPLPPQVRRVVLPKPEKDFRVRGQRLRQAVREEGLDALIYCAGSNPTLLYDLLVTKAEGIPFILSIHDSAFHSLLSGSSSIAARPAVSRLADVAQVLSAAEEVYWRSQGVKAVFLPNPATSEIVEAAELEPQPGNLLWVGRLDLWVKRCLDPVKAMAIVARAHPSAKLHIVGMEWTPGASEKILQEIDRLGIQENVMLCQPTQEIEKYYRRAAVVVMTSVTECSPMTVTEAKAFGIPIAMYSLPHPAMLQDGKGFLSVPQGDTEELARAIISMLDDEAQRVRIGSEGRQSLARFMDVDIEEEWRRLFLRAGAPSSAADARPADIDTVGALISNALDIYSLGARRRHEENRALRRQVSQLRGELKSRTRGKRASRRRRFVQLGVAAGLGGTGSIALLVLILLQQWQAAMVVAVALLVGGLAASVLVSAILLRRLVGSGKALPRLPRATRAAGSKRAAR